MELEFQAVSSFPRGTLCALLSDAYDFDARYARRWASEWRAFDDFFFTRPDIADRCGFITVHGSEPVGFASWDPRRAPESITVGHNCIATAHKGKNWGVLQMREALRRIRAWSPAPEKILVTTNAGLLPAIRMYERVGFRLVCRRANPDFCGDFLDCEYILR